MQVLENRVEWNQPYSYCTGDCLCPWRVNCHVVDNTKVLYLDRALALNVAKVECCSPVCTHNDCIPTCFDQCGESIIMYENVGEAGCMECQDCFTCCHVYNVRAAVGQRPRTCCSAEHVRIDCLADAQCTSRNFHYPPSLSLSDYSLFVVLAQSSIFEYLSPHLCEQRCPSCLASLTLFHLSRFFLLRPNQPSSTPSTPPATSALRMAASRSRRTWAVKVFLRARSRC